MRKLSLKIDELRVESFHTAEEAGARGTVLAHGTREPVEPNISRSCDTNDQSQCDSCYFQTCFCEAVAIADTV